MSLALDKLRAYASWIIALIVGLIMSRAFDVPQDAGFTASLLQQQQFVLSFVAVAVAMVASYAIAWVLAGRINPDLPLAAAAMSLLPFTMRGGSMFYTLKQGDGAGVYLLLAVETVMLFAMLGALYIAGRPLRQAARLQVPASIDPARLPDPLDDPTRDEPLDQKLLAMAAQTIIMAFLVLIVAKNDAKQQALFAVFISATIASWCAHRFIPASTSLFYWLGPVLVALLGYVSGYFAGAPGQVIGEPQHYVAALARAAPLDYASLGVAGALWGFSMRRGAQLAQAELARDEADAKKSRSPAPASA